MRMILQKGNNLPVQTHTRPQTQLTRRACDAKVEQSTELAPARSCDPITGGTGPSINSSQAGLDTSPEVIADGIPAFDSCSAQGLFRSV